MPVPLSDAQVFFLILLRTGAALLVMPVLNSRVLPAPARLGLVGALALVLTPRELQRTPPLPTDTLPFLLLAAHEFLIGLLIGFAGTLVFAAAQMAGQLLGLQLGLNIAVALDPFNPGQHVSFLDQFYTLLAVLLFFSTQAYHGVLLALASSYDLAPLGAVPWSDRWLDQVLALTTGSLVVALRLALPVLAALLLTDLALLVLNRAMPQMNVFLVGLSVKALLGLAILGLALPTIVHLLGTVLRALPTAMLSLLGAPGHL